MNDTTASGETPAAPAKALAHGVTVLQILVQADEPLSASEIARRMGLHQSSVSRILSTLAVAGYVRKISYRRFAPDFGVLSLAAAAINKFSLATKPRAALEQAAERASGLAVTLATLWRGEVIYFLRTEKDNPHPLVATELGWPLHLSAPALRLLVERPRAEALQLLRESRERHGWNRASPDVPATEAETLDTAIRLVDHDCLILDGWIKPGHVSSAIIVAAPGEPPTALAMTGPADLVDHQTLRLWLHEFRRSIENALAQ
jgi:DNA-binding IclR family transcriptional regulator